MRFFDKDDIKISFIIRMNGHDLEVTPSSFQVHDGDQILISLKVDLPVVLRDDEKPGVRILRAVEVIDPAQVAEAG